MQFFQKIECCWESKAMVRGGSKACPSGLLTRFLASYKAPPPLKKIIKFRFLGRSEGGSAPKFGPASRREIRNRHGRVPGRKNRRKWAETPSDVQKTRFWVAPSSLERAGAGFWQRAEIS